MKVLSGKIPVYIHPLFWALIFMIGWLYTFSIPGTLVWGVVILYSVLIHEFGHALTAVAFGQKVKVELYAMGGVTHRRGGKLPLWKEFFIVLNGPSAGFALFFLAYYLRFMLGVREPTLFTYAIDVTIYVNLFWTLINLLPIQPLDGGHLLRIMLEGVFGFRGIKIAYFISILLAAGLGVFFFATRALLIGVIFFLLAFESFRAWRGTLSLTEQDQNEELQKMLREAERAMEGGRLDEAIQLLQRVRRETGEGILFQAASEDLAEIYAQDGKFLEAYDLLYPIKNKLRPEAVRLLHQIAYRGGKWEEAISLGNESYQYFPSGDTAVINAICHSVLGQTQPAIGWLQRALDEGVPNFHEILKKREFDLIRDTPQFQELLKPKKRN